MPKWFQYFLRLLGFEPKPARRSASQDLSRLGLHPIVRRYFPIMSLRRYTGEGKPPRLEWKASHPSTIKRFKAEVTCSRGHGIALRNHTVEADGRVVPSIVCLEPGCDFHEIVRLDGWAAGRIPAQSEDLPVKTA